MYTKETEWKSLVDSLQQKISKNNSSQESRLFFEQTMIGNIIYVLKLCKSNLYFILYYLKNNFFFFFFNSII